MRMGMTDAIMFFSGKISDFFNEMEMEISVINNGIFTKLLLKIKVSGKEISYHFLAKSKPHERIDLLITTNMNIYQTKKNCNGNENILL